MAARFAKVATAAVASVAFAMQTQLTSYTEKQPTTSSLMKGPEVQVGQASQLKKNDESCNVELSPEDFKKELAAAVKEYFDVAQRWERMDADFQKKLADFQIETERRNTDSQKIRADAKIEREAILADSQIEMVDSQKEIERMKADTQREVSKINDERIQFLRSVKVVMGFSFIIFLANVILDEVIEKLNKTTKR